MSTNSDNEIGNALNKIYTNKDKQHVILESSDNKIGSVIFDDKNLFFGKEIKLDESGSVNQKPFARIDFTPEKPKAGDIVNLDSSKSSDPDGTIVSRQWTISPNTVKLNVSSDSITANFVYPETIDSVSITLVVTDDKNESTSLTGIIKRDKPEPTDNKINPVSVKASNQDAGKEAEKTLDGDFETRWSAEGDGQYIEYTLPKIYKITRVKLTGYWYDKAYFFEIAGKRFECPKGRAPNTLIEYDLRDLKIDSNKLKIVGHGNDTTAYNSYREIQIFGIESDNQPPTSCPLGQCKDRVTNQCRSIGINEEIDLEGYCKLKIIDPPIGKGFNLISWGDSDTTNNAEKNLTTILKIKNVLGYLFVGDGPYASTGTKFVNMMKKYFNTPELVSKLIFSQGNHEDEESETEQSQKDIELGFPTLNLANTPEVDPSQNSWEKTSWLTAKQIENVYIISMNSQDQDIEFKRNQYNWVIKQLNIAKGLRDLGKIDWIFVMIHKPWYTLKSSHSPYTAVRFLYGQLFKDFGVDLLLEGHNHNYQMWLPMIPNESEANGEGQQLFTKLPTGEFDFNKVHGQASIVNGNGGHEHNIFKEDSKNNPNVLYANDTDYGFTIINIDGKVLTAQALDIDGNVLFTYPKIIRGESLPEKLDSEAEALIIAKVGETILLKDQGSTGPITNFEWLKETTDAQAITLIDEPSVRFGKKFVATEAMTEQDIKFKLRVFDKDGNFDDDITGTKVTIIKEIPQNNILWDSNIHGKWNNGVKRTVTDTEGDQSPNGKGIFTAASGDPRLIIDGDGIAHLQADAGHGRIYIKATNFNSRLEYELKFEDENIDNTSFKMRSRHGEGGSGENRFGGAGGHISMKENNVGVKVEKFHNEHESGKEVSLPKRIELNQWIKVALEVTSPPNTNSLTSKVEVDYNDGQGFREVVSQTLNNVPDYYIDESKFMEESYFWLRVNNEKTGQVAFRNVKLIKLD